MKGKSCYPSRRTSALLISSMCIAFVWFIAYHERTLKQSFTPIRSNLGNAQKPRNDRTQLRNEDVLNAIAVDVITKDINIEQNKGADSYDTGTNNEDSVVIVNNAPWSIPNSMQSDAFNKVPDTDPNAKQGIFINILPDSIVNTLQRNEITNLQDSTTSIKQGSFTNNVSDSVSNTKQGNNYYIQGNFISDKPRNVKHNMPGITANAKQSDADNKLPDNIPLTMHHNAINGEAPYIVREKVPTASSDHQLVRGLPQYAESIKRKPVTLQDYINLGHIAEEHVTVNNYKSISRVGIGNSGDVQQDGIPRTNVLSGNTNNSLKQKNKTSVNDVRQNNLVLLLTYLRSGSTLTADIIQQVPGVFYAYEPLKRYIATDVGYISTNGICLMNNLTCRQPTLISELPQLYIEDIVRYYGCDLNHVVGPFLWSESSLSVRKFKDCTRVTTQLNADNQFCLHQCFQSTRYLKTIRLSMDIVEILMKIIPRLKVIHLLRDPRGMIDSRKRGGFLGRRMDIDVTIVARAVCQRFERDIEIAVKLKKKYPGRLKTYLYEQIAEHPKSASESLFNFLGLTAADDFGEWLHNHTAAGTNGKFYDTLRANSSLTASLWRLRMPYNDVLKIDNECKIFYNYTGFLKVVTKKSLRDLNLHLRLPSTDFGIVL